jgi:hypothetical protein
MKLESASYQSHLEHCLNVSVKLDEYELHRSTAQGENMLTVILDRVVEKIADAFIEKHGAELLASIETEVVAAQVQEEISKQIAREAIRKILTN